jgi:hypothetical protein
MAKELNQQDMNKPKVNNKEYFCARLTRVREGTKMLIAKV